MPLVSNYSNLLFPPTWIVGESDWLLLFLGNKLTKNS